MKKYTVALVLPVLLTGALPAAAQSSFAAFGVVDLALRRVHNDQTQYRLDGGGLSTSRLGLRGLEDLGEGLRAGFWLEGQINADDGSGFNWQRRSTVSLISRRWGEIRLGRDKVPSNLNWTSLDPFEDTGLAASSKLAQLAGMVPAGGAFNGFSRLSNMVAYIAPAGSGFFGQVALAAGEGALGNRHLGARVGYDAGPLLVAGSWGQTEVTPNIDAKAYNFGASYDMALVKLYAMFARLDIGPQAQLNAFVGASAPIGAFVLRATYQRMAGRQGAAGSKAGMLGLGGEYRLSRRSALYFTYAVIDNQRSARFAVASTSALAAGQNSNGADFGLRHRF